MNWNEIEKKLMDEVVPDEYKSNPILLNAYLKGAYDLHLLYEKIFGDDRK